MTRRALLLAPAVLFACGYVVEGDRRQERLEGGELPRVAVLPFDNRTFRRGLEMRLTRLVDDEIRARSPRAVYRPAEADWLLEGSILEAEERILSEDRADEVRESSFVVTAEVVLRERATEKILGTYSFTERAPFSARAGRVTTLEQAEEEALRDLAERIVYALESRKA